MDRVANDARPSTHECGSVLMLNLCLWVFYTYRRQFFIFHIIPPHVCALVPAPKGGFKSQSFVVSLLLYPHDITPVTHCGEVRTGAWAITPLISAGRFALIVNELLRFTYKLLIRAFASSPPALCLASEPPAVMLV